MELVCRDSACEVVRRMQIFLAPALYVEEESPKLQHYLDLIVGSCGEVCGLKFCTSS